MLDRTPATSCSRSVPSEAGDHDGVRTAVPMADRGAPAVQLNGDALLLDAVREGFPHLARAETRIVELLDQGRLAAAEAHHLEDRLREREVLDPLRGPRRLDLGARDTPHLLGVRPEERVVQPLAEASRDPVLERLRVAGASRAIPQVRRGAQRGLDDAESRDDVRRLKGVREVLAVVVDAGQAWPDEEFLAERRLPEALDRRELGEEPVAAEVEAIPVALDGLREATDDPVGLEHRPSLAAQRQYVGGRQPGRACAEHGVSVRRTVEIGRLAQATESTSPR